MKPHCGCTDFLRRILAKPCLQNILLPCATQISRDNSHSYLCGPGKEPDYWRLHQICDGSRQQFWIVLKVTKTFVAVATEHSPDSTSAVIVVYSKFMYRAALVFSRFGVTTDSTQSSVFGP